jgi:hypothetical protein
MLPPLGIIFGLLVGFIAVQVWNDFDRAKVAVASEASALRGVILFANSFPEEEKSRLRAIINRHIQEAVQQEWHAMAEQRATLATWPMTLMEALQVTLTLKPADDTQRTAQREMVNALGGPWKRGVSASSSANHLSAQSNRSQSFCRGCAH